jgi:hypothetical protein
MCSEICTSKQSSDYPYVKDTEYSRSVRDAESTCKIDVDYGSGTYTTTCHDYRPKAGGLMKGFGSGPKTSYLNETTVRIGWGETPSMGPIYDRSVPAPEGGIVRPPTPSTSYVEK